MNRLRRVVGSLSAGRPLDLWACAAASLLVAAAVPATAQTRPASYAEFHTAIAPNDGAALNAAIDGEVIRYIYLQRGNYVLDNPVVIDRTTSLFIHGLDRMTTTLVALDPTKPLFEVRNAPLLNFAEVRFQPNRNLTSTLHATAIRTINTQPVNLELQECLVDAAMFDFAGPGSYRSQNCSYAPGGKTRAAITVDHPSADVLVFGGDITNGPNPRRVDDAYHVWQKRGRLRIYTTTVEAALGRADFRIDTRSALGPHVIANVRSEGANGALHQTGAVSRLLYVPTTSEAVDVVVKNSGGAWLTGPPSRDPNVRINCKLAWYNGAGTLWMLGNRSEVCARHVVEGNAPLATIISVGNDIASPEPLPVVAQRVVTAGDQYSHFQWTGGGDWGGDTSGPWTRRIPGASLPPALGSSPNVPLPPQDILPPSLARPIVTAALPGMINVKAAPYNARGNGVADDTAAIQAALDFHCNRSTAVAVYFPAGTYKVRNTLYLNHHSGGTCRGKMPYGGWIAGAGSGVTTLQMATGVKKGVFATDGFAHATVQGLTFKTWTWQTGDPREPNFDIEMHTGFIASQQDSLYDVVFDGGYAAFATGVRRPTQGQCSSIAIFRGVMKNAQLGFVSGHYNAIANVVYDSQFINNKTAMASWTTDEVNLTPGGTFSAYRTTSRGGQAHDFIVRGSGTGSSWYFYEWDSDAPSYMPLPGSAATAYPIMLERATLAPRPGATYLFDLDIGMGPFFLYSNLTRGGIRIGHGGLAHTYVVKLGSAIPDWASSVVGVNGQLEEMSGSAPAGIGPPGKPAPTQ